MDQAGRRPAWLAWVLRNCEVLFLIVHVTLSRCCFDLFIGGEVLGTGYQTWARSEETSVLNLQPETPETFGGLSRSLDRLTELELPSEKFAIRSA